MSDLRTLPAIRAEAERLARDVYEAQSKTLHANGMGPSLLWELLPERTRSAYVGGHLDLLCNMTRPASRDAVARLVAEKVGIECGAAAPDVRRFRRLLRDGSESWVWALLGSPGEQFFFGEENVPGVSAITDPAEALRLIATHVLRNPDV